MVVCPQTFIVRNLIIGNTQQRHIHTQTERRGKGQAAGETERECVRDREWLKMELVSVVKTAVGRMMNYFGIF